ncbi:MAG: hypothetical protein ACI4NP_02200 [Thermoguttaceae bacterium]
MAVGVQGMRGTRNEKKDMRFHGAYPFVLRIMGRDGKDEPQPKVANRTTIIP